jgi:single-strand DNA-binding protein
MRKIDFSLRENRFFNVVLCSKTRFWRFYKHAPGGYDRAIKLKGAIGMINQVTIVGRLTRDPEAKVTTEGIPVAHVTLAVNRQYRNQSGEQEADFISCTLWRKAAQNTAQYCRKGSVVGITGRIQTRHYDTQEGKRVYVTEVIADTVRFLSSKPQVETKEPRIEEELPF